MEKTKPTKSANLIDYLYNTNSAFTSQIRTSRDATTYDEHFMYCFNVFQMYQSHAMRKCVFVISDQVRFKTASSATETRYIIEILYLARVGLLLSRQRTKRC